MTPARRAFWLKHLHRWHWISAATCLVGMLLFAVTGITLNHAGQIEARPQVTARTATLPAELLAQVLAAQQAGAAVPAAAADWIAQAIGVQVGAREPEWSDEELYVGLPRPGGDAWLTLDLGSGQLDYERTDRGFVSWLNDLHKGRNTGAAWSWFLDAFAIACMVFCATGLFLLQMHSRARPATWPMVALGVVAPLLLILLFMH